MKRLINDTPELENNLSSVEERGKETRIGGGRGCGGYTANIETRSANTATRDCELRI
jgi:hypothetical protein